MKFAEKFGLRYDRILHLSKGRGERRKARGFLAGDERRGRKLQALHLPARLEKFQLLFTLSRLDFRRNGMLLSKECRCVFVAGFLVAATKVAGLANRSDLCRQVKRRGLRSSCLKVDVHCYVANCMF